jgi:hypothetical protein
MITVGQVSKGFAALEIDPLNKRRDNERLKIFHNGPPQCLNNHSF